MTMRSERNEKLLKVIDEAVATSSSSVEALDKIVPKTINRINYYS